MPAVTVTDLNNAKLDVDHIADVATSLLPTVIDRLGHVKQTMSAAGNAIALTAAGQATTARIAAESARDAALLSQGAAAIGKPTLALLNADLIHAAGTVAFVSNDTNPTNNGLYRKYGASGAGGWTWTQQAPLFYSSPSEVNGTASEIYNLQGFSGWAATVKTDLAVISRVGIKKSSFAAAFVNPTFSLRLVELAAPSQDVATGTLIELFSVPTATWSALAVGDEYSCVLTSPFTPNPGKFYALIASSDFAANDPVNIKQTGVDGATSYGPSANFLQGWYRQAYNAAWGAISYGLHFSLYGQSQPSNLANTFAAQQAVNKTLAASVVVAEPSGVAGSVYQFSGFRGIGVILVTRLIAIKSIVVKRHAIGMAYKNSNYTAQLVELSAATAGAVATGNVIQSFTVPVSAWAKLTENDDLLMSLTTPYTPVPGKFYAVLFYSDYVDFDQVSAKQTGDGFAVSGSYRLGIFMPSGGGWNAVGGVSSGSYGLYARLENSVASELQARQIPVDITPLTARVDALSSNYFRALRLADNPLKSCPVFNKSWLRRDKDVYGVLWGDSITAYQSSIDKPRQGVSQVPPVCDRLGLANRIFNSFEFGHPVYRRFDYGKNALVGFWDATWAGGDAAYFTESGAFQTFYTSANTASDLAENLTAPQFTTAISTSACPVGAFHETEGQRNIPKRLSGAAGAFVSFVIPAGYEKADFIYHTHSQGDDLITVSVSTGVGKLIVKDANVSWTTAVEANGKVFSMRETHLTSDDGYDSGILQKRLHFKKVNIADTVTVTITKSADTAKFLLYWGATYWGTPTNPNASHLIATGRGGYSLGGLYAHRIVDVAQFKPDLVIQEHTAINNFSGGAATYLASFALLKAYFSAEGVQWFTVLPNTTTTLANNAPDQYKVFWNTLKSASIEAGVPVVDVEGVFFKMWQYLYPTASVSYAAWLNGYLIDGTHPNTKGFDVFDAVIAPIFDQI